MSEDDKKKRPRHTPAICEVKQGDYFFSGSMARHCGQWVPRYTCPSCGRQMRMPQNYLGGGSLVCTGDRFWKPHEQTIGKMRRDDFVALVNGPRLKP
jgi:hypothetical protein